MNLLDAALLGIVYLAKDSLAVFAIYRVALAALTAVWLMS